MVTIIVGAVWVFFVALFIVVRLFYPDLGGHRHPKQIKPRREYDDHGYDRRGFTSLGYHRNGTRYDDDGYDKDGLDRAGNPRPVQVEYDPVLNGEEVVTDAKRKQMMLVAIGITTAFLLLLVIGKYVLFDSCLLGHKPMETFCEQPTICVKCEKEIGDAPGHTWITDKKTGDEVCVKCRTPRENAQ